MAHQPDWARRGVIAAYVIGIPTIALAALAYVRPRDPAHPVRFDFIYNQISISIPLWLLLLLLLGISAVVTLALRGWAGRHPDPVLASELVPMPKQVFDLENERNDLNNQLLECQRASERLKEESANFRSQLNTPKLSLQVMGFEVLEEQADIQPGPTERLLYITNDCILIIVDLKISNANRVETNIQSIGMAIRLAPTGPLAHSGAPARFPEVLQTPIKFGLPVRVSLEFRIEHSDAQSIVKNYFVIAATDGTDQRVETAPQQITRVIPKSAASRQ